MVERSQIKIDALENQLRQAIADNEKKIKIVVREHSKQLQELNEKSISALMQLQVREVLLNHMYKYILFYFSCFIFFVR